METNAYSLIVPAVATLYERIVDPGCAIRRITLTCNNVRQEQDILQFTMFEDTEKQLKNKRIQETMLELKARYGKNIILKGVNFDKAATGRERNMQIGGHKSGGTN
jgi:DNA polymerase V